ncbi:high mobility group B protein 10-like [Abrus precatorius]|uniref:High mobility group B protein 10-like n=1 Tax=Abrus precatorius TaxID=3816 RepID=A0A8B8M902_ABRPR|nr:high mobility group B protein 10-like [Abrus precatorius]
MVPSPSNDDSDIFYLKLTELLESSGLTLIFNVRETLLDLYLFYLEVTKRGGYHQVGREKKWSEVVSALKLEGNNVKLCAQIEMLYAHLLYQFEQLYFYRSPTKPAATSSTKGLLKRKHNSTVSLSQIRDTKDGQVVTKMSKDCSSQMTGGSCDLEVLIMQCFMFQLKARAGFVERPVLLAIPSNDKEMKKRRGAPQGQKNAYQIFIKQECARLRTRNEASDGHRILHMAIDAWKKMSEIEKQPYVEESKKNKEKFKEAMISHNKQQNMHDTREEKRPSLSDDYHVTLQPEADDSFVNKAEVGLALKMTEKTSKETLFLMEWDAACSLDFPTEESKELY